MTVPMKKPRPGEKYNYGHVMGLSLLFYEAQRSGALPKNNRIPWRGDSALEDGKDVGVDLTGGWYDAGDHVKFNFPMAWSATTLAWGVHEYWDAWKQAGELEHALDQLKWVADYLVKCHPDKDTYYVQVGDGNSDHGYWGTAESMTMNRPAHAVGRGNGRQAGSAAIGEAAAALAATSLLFKQHGDTTYAAQLVATAKSLFELGNTNQGGFSVSQPFYSSSGFADELAWAAAWLYEATGDKEYLDAAEGLYNGGCCGTAWSYSWDAKAPGVQLLLYKQTRKPQYKTDSSNFVGGAISKRATPKGLAYWDKWGSNRYAANGAFIALVAADYGIHTDDGRAWATRQINYMLGDAHGGINKETGLPFYSYVCGYGDNFPKVRSATPPLPPSLPPSLPPYFMSSSLWFSSHISQLNLSFLSLPSTYSSLLSTRPPTIAVLPAGRAPTATAAQALSPTSSTAPLWVVRGTEMTTPTAARTTPRTRSRQVHSSFPPSLPPSFPPSSCSFSSHGAGGRSSYDRTACHT